MAALQRVSKSGKVGGDGGPVDMERAIAIQGAMAAVHSRPRERLRELDRPQGHFRRPP